MSQKVCKRIQEPGYSDRQEERRHVLGRLAHMISVFRIRNKGERLKSPGKQGLSLDWYVTNVRGSQDE